jgi:hypothetical protein
MTLVYRRVMSKLLRVARVRYAFLATVVVLLLGAIDERLEPIPTAGQGAQSLRQARQWSRSWLSRI